LGEKNNGLKKGGVMAGNKKTWKPIIAIVLVVIMVIAMTRTIMKIASSRSRRRPQAASQVAAPVVPVEQVSPASDTKEQSQQRSWGDDPFTGRAIRSSFGKTALFQLSGIVYNSLNPSESYAIIDNSVVKVGDTLGDEGMQVKEIKEQEVLLGSGSKEMTLKLW
jgi:hypothetical protein